MTERNPNKKRTSFLDAAGRSIFGERKANLSEGTRKYATNEEVNRMTETAVAAIENAGGNEPDFGGVKAEKLRKMATLALRADPNNAEARFRPGSRLRTYTGNREESGQLKDETYKGEATVGEGHTVYRNMEPLKYPEDWKVEELRGKPIMGRYTEDATFVEDPNGSEMLYNEYVTEDPDHPMRKYGITPKAGEWTEGMAQIPSYLLEIPPGTPEFEVITAGGKHVSVQGGDFVVIDDLGGGKTGVQAIERGAKERTYKPWA